MTLKNIAVEGCTLSEPTAQITTPASTKVKADGKGVYSGPLTISISGYSGQGIEVGTGTDTLQPTATKVKVEGKMVILEGDQVTITVTGQTPQGASASVPVNVKIQDAGQSKAKGA